MNWYKQYTIASFDKEALNWKPLLLVLLPVVGWLGLDSAYAADLAKRKNYNPPAIKQELKEIAKKKGFDPSITNKKIDGLNLNVSQNTPKNPNPQTQPTTKPVVNLDNLKVNDYMQFTIPYETFKSKFEPKVYKDSKGLRTIGYGTNIESDANGPAKIKSIGLNYENVLNGKQTISEKQARLLMEDDMQKAMKSAYSIFPSFNNLPEKIKLIVVDMIYNMGEGFVDPKTGKGRGFKSLRSFISELKKENIDWKKVTKNMTKTKWFKDVGRRSKDHVKTVNNIGS